MSLTVTVVIPTYGRPQLIREALASVRNQTHPADEIIIVDDGSPTALEASIVGPGVQLIRHEENLGPSASRNSGIRAATGDVIFFLDDDDLFEPMRIERALLAHEKGVDIAACWTILDGKEPPERGRMLTGNVHDTIADSFTPSMGATSVLRTSCPLFNTALDYGEDIDWWIRATLKCTVRTVTAFDYRVRLNSGPRDRTDHRRRSKLAGTFIDFQREYLDTHPKALAFRYRRLGHYRRIAGDRSGAFRAHLREAWLKKDPVALARAMRALLITI